MSDMLALREHLNLVKKQQHTVRNYSTFTRISDYLSDVTENNSKGGHRTGEGNLLLCSTVLTYLQDFCQVVKSKYETTGTEKTMTFFFLSATQVLSPLQMN